MSFFERPSAPEPADAWPEQDVADLDPRSSYLGGVVPVEVVLARSDAAVAALRSIVAYPDGFEFTLNVWVRRPVARNKRRWRWGSIMLDSGDIDDDEPLPDDFFRFGIEFPDGARVSNLDRSPWDLSPDATEPQHGMHTGSGSGSDTEYTQEWWAWPVPDSGIIAFVCEWPAYGIGETRIELDASLIRDAADRAQPVWPDTVTGRTHWSPWDLSRTIRGQVDADNPDPDGSADS